MSRKPIDHTIPNQKAAGAELLRRIRLVAPTVGSFATQHHDIVKDTTCRHLVDGVYNMGAGWSDELHWQYALVLAENDIEVARFINYSILLAQGVVPDFAENRVTETLVRHAKEVRLLRLALDRHTKALIAAQKRKKQVT